MYRKIEPHRFWTFQQSRTYCIIQEEYTVSISRRKSYVSSDISQPQSMAGFSEIISVTFFEVKKKKWNSCVLYSSTWLFNCHGSCRHPQGPKTRCKQHGSDYLVYPLWGETRCLEVCELRDSETARPWRGLWTQFQELTNEVC